MLVDYYLVGNIIEETGLFTEHQEEPVVCMVVCGTR